MWYPGKKDRTKPDSTRRNHYADSEGNVWTQRQIDRKRSEAYRIEHEKEPSFWCEGCGQLAQCHAHIIPQARCKQIKKTELIWTPANWFNSCFKCNSAIENPKGEAWKSLKNIDSCIQFIYANDKELYFKFEAQGWQAENSLLKQFTDRTRTNL